MSKFYLFFLLLAMLSVNISVKAQDVELYSKRVKELSSEKMYGRSKFMDGSKKAAQYIIRELQKNKGVSIEKQEFSYPMNVMRGDLKFSADGELFTPVSEYIVREFSSAKKGKFPVVYLEEKYYDPALFFEYMQSGEFKNKFVVMDFKRFMGKLDDRDISGVEVYNKYFEKMDNVGGIILMYREVPKFFKARAHYTVPFPVVCVGPRFTKDVKEIEISLDTEFFPKHDAENLFGTIKGESSDKCYMFVAHYDHLEMMGRDNVYLGANDNASGVSFLLTMADYFSQPENKPKYDVVLFFADGEEGNLLGSKYAAEHPLRPLSEIDFLFNIDMMADNGENLCVEISEVALDDLALMRTINKENNIFKEIERHPLSDNSDHFYFAIRGVPCMYYTFYGDYFKYYHTPSDTYDNFTTHHFQNLFDIIIKFMDLR